MNKYLVRRIIATIIASIILVGLIFGIVWIFATIGNWILFSKARFAIYCILGIAFITFWCYKEFQK